MTPRVDYWHLWTDEDGVSHQTRCALENFEFKGVGDADPQWNDKQQRGEATVVFTVQPVGWVGEWHENPAPQWIVPLSGSWWVEQAGKFANDPVYDEIVRRGKAYRQSQRPRPRKRPR